MFVAYMDSMGHVRTMIRTYISALSHEHNLVDEDDPTAKFWVRKVVDVAGSACSPGAKCGISSKGSFHRFCVLQTTQRECARDQNPEMLRDYAKHRPGQWTGPCLCGSQENKWRLGRSCVAYNTA